MKAVPAGDPALELEERANRLYEQIEVLHRRRVELDNETREVWREIRRVHESQFYYELAHGRK